ncbi:acid phosphatase [Methylocapsa acidiphila]|uniref:acid phosphatase n=1 Tax=Methylocapsa acidiphila TaxID=133552 RepID=UPI0004252990|nr:acid phosphatase [Methylocapsa acidiphila]
MKNRQVLRRAVIALGAVACSLAGAKAAEDGPASSSGLEKIETIVVIYAENRSFDNLYGHFPGANGLANVTPEMARQTDRDGSVLKELPPIWGGLTPPNFSPAVGQAATEHLPNGFFAIDDSKGLNTPLSTPTRDLWHLFYQNQMQINGGKNDRFVAYGNAGALPMGYYDGSKLPLWEVAKKYVLADNFFMAAFGGSFVNHFYLICSCEPRYPSADKSPAKGLIAAVESDGVTLKLAPDSPKSALDGPPIFVNNGTITPGPDFYAVNTMQPPYQPSGVKPASGGDPAYANPGAETRLPPQQDTTIGDLLHDKKIDWAWYAGAWGAALDGKPINPSPNFQFHHQPFNYFAAYAPGTEKRAKHLLDGGINGDLFIQAIDAGTLPAVTFYKPQGSLNEHPGYAEVLAGDRHIAEIVEHLEKSPQWAHMFVLITYDENGGFWDHVAPPKADRWGPGNRIPAIIVSPYAKKGFVDHTLYDTTSALRLITRRFNLPVLDGLKERDAALEAAGGQKLGDMTGALDLAAP